jgi:hypothetical protein
MSNDPKLSRKLVRSGTYTVWNSFTYDGVLTEEEAAQKQRESGYDPCGYGFYSFKVKNGKTLWECSNNCD